jgi:hypothetical protein
MSVVNGGRVPVELPDFSGLAGFTPDGRLAELTYLPISEKAPVPGSTIPIDGVTWIIVRVEASPYLRGRRQLSLRKKG